MKNTNAGAHYNQVCWRRLSTLHCSASDVKLFVICRVKHCTALRRQVYDWPIRVKVKACIFETRKDGSLEQQFSYLQEEFGKRYKKPSICVGNCVEQISTGSIFSKTFLAISVIPFRSAKCDVHIKEKHLSILALIFF